MRWAAAVLVLGVNSVYSGALTAQPLRSQEDGPPDWRETGDVGQLWRWSHEGCGPGWSVSACEALRLELEAGYALVTFLADDDSPPTGSLIPIPSGELSHPLALRYYADHLLPTLDRRFVFPVTLLLPQGEWTVGETSFSVNGPHEVVTVVPGTMDPAALRPRINAAQVCAQQAILSQDTAARDREWQQRRSVVGAAVGVVHAPTDGALSQTLALSWRAREGGLYTEVGAQIERGEELGGTPNLGTTLHLGVGLAWRLATDWQANAGAHLVGGLGAGEWSCDPDLASSQSGEAVATGCVRSPAPGAEPLVAREVLGGAGVHSGLSKSIKLGGERLSVGGGLSAELVIVRARKAWTDASVEGTVGGTLRLEDSALVLLPRWSPTVWIGGRF